MFDKNVDILKLQKVGNKVGKAWVREEYHKPRGELYGARFVEEQPGEHQLDQQHYGFSDKHGFVIDKLLRHTDHGDST